MEKMIKNTQDVAVSASPRQDIALVEGNKVPSPDKMRASARRMSRLLQRSSTSRLKPIRLS